MTKVKNTKFEYECLALSLKSTTPIPCGSYYLCFSTKCKKLPKNKTKKDLLEEDNKSYYRSPIPFYSKETNPIPLKPKKDERNE